MNLLRYLAQLFLVTAVYVITGRYGLLLHAVNSFATLIWIPTGFSLATLLIGGFRLWPAIFLGAFIVNLLTGATFFVALGIAVGNTLEAVVAYFILKRFFHFQNSLERMRDLLGFIFITSPLGAIISATCGVISLMLGGFLPQNTFSVTWIAWFIGNYLSAILITPFLLIWSTPFPSLKPTTLRIIEAFTATFLLIFLCFFVFTNFSPTDKAPIGYLLFLPLTWIALRFGPRATITSVIVVAFFVIYGTISGSGPFSQENLKESIGYLQTYIVTLTLTTFILAAVVDENRKFAKRKDEFISMASHELKTPLTSITLLMQLLQKRLKRIKDPQSLSLTKKTNEQIGRMSRLINDLLDLSKIQTGKLIMRKKKFSIEPVIREIVGNMQKLTKTHTIVIKGQTKKKVYADKEKISQVIINLLTNAIKYSPKSDKIILTIQTTKQYIIIDVQDFGIGIAKENQVKIFEHLFRVHEKAYPGFGIGLYVSNEIIEKHQGELWLKSTKGRGSIFSFSLPIFTP